MTLWENVKDLFGYNTNGQVVQHPAQAGSPSMVDQLFGGAGEAVGSLGAGLVRPLLGPLVLLMFFAIVFFYLMFRVDKMLVGAK